MQASVQRLFACAAGVTECRSLTNRDTHMAGRLMHRTANICVHHASATMCMKRGGTYASLCPVVQLEQPHMGIEALDSPGVDTVALLLGFAGNAVNMLRT